MKSPSRSDTAFRVAFVVLVATALITLFWQCSGQPGGPSRVGWPTNSTSNP
jgi:hypothetical protein